MEGERFREKVRERSVLRDKRGVETKIKERISRRHEDEAEIRETRKDRDRQMMISPGREGRDLLFSHPKSLTLQIFREQ